MKTVTIEKNSREFTFICNFRDTRDGFAHDCVMYVNNDNCFTSHCYYLNRTWESWNFQSVCLKAIQGEIEYRIQYLKAKYLHEKEFKRLTQQREKGFKIYCDNDPYLKTCLQVKEELKNNLY